MNNMSVFVFHESVHNLFICSLKVYRLLKKVILINFIDKLNRNSFMSDAENNEHIGKNWRIWKALDNETYK